jgi:hypothetical protein
MLTTMGLLSIAGAWLLQLIQSKEKLDSLFVAFYCFGVLLLIFDAAGNGQFQLAFLNVFTLLAASLVLLRIGNKETVKKQRKKR